MMSNNRMHQTTPSPALVPLSRYPRHTSVWFRFLMPESPWDMPFRGMKLYCICPGANYRDKPSIGPSIVLARVKCNKFKPE